MAEFFTALFKHKRENQRAEWNKTRLVEERVKRTGFYEEKGFIRKEKIFQGRPIIGRDRKINGGVYLGESSREAIVVDDAKDPLLEKIYQELLKRRRDAELKGKDFKDGVLEEVWELVNQVMPYDELRVQEINESLSEPDTKIYLSAFIGGGVCRHQALLIGFLLEKLSKEGFVGGNVSIDRNYVPDQGGHAWARYTNSRGDVFILDSAQHYIGRLDEMSNDRSRWFYERPEDSNPKLKPLIKLRRMFMGN